MGATLGAMFLPDGWSTFWKSMAGGSGERISGRSRHCAQVEKRVCHHNGCPTSI